MHGLQPPRRIRLLGGEVDLIEPARMLDRVEDMIARGSGGVVANHNAHSLYLLRRHQQLAAFFASADVIQVDSAPLIAWGAVLGVPIGRRHRSTYLDWRDDFWPLAEARRWRVFYLGGAPGVALAACERLIGTWPNLALAHHHGFFDAALASESNERVLAAIGAFAPHILLVGMGMPRQECWILDNRAALGPAVIFSVGAAFDYEAGAQRAAPRWSGPLGVEWAFRLARDPARLAKRYLIEPWFLLPRALADIAAAGARRGGKAWASAGRRP